MSRQTRRVVLDGRDAGDYTGGWQETFDDQAFLGTLWTATFNSSIESPSNASMTFSFDGSEFDLYGRSNISSSGLACTIDGNLATLVRSGSPEQFSCSWRGTNSTNHTFQLSAESSIGAVAIDSVWFLPSFNSPLDNSFVEYRQDELPVSLVSGRWQPLEHEGSNATSTTTVNSTLTFVFTGTGVIAEGWRVPASPATNSTATYSVDNDPPMSFEFEPSNQPAETIRNQELFQISNLRAGYHRLEITYMGPSTPLVLERFLVRGDGILLDELPSPSGDSSPTPTASPRASGGRSGENIVIIVLPIVGACVLVALLVYRYIWVYPKGRKRPRAPPTEVELDVRRPSEPQPQGPPPYQPPLDEFSPSYPPPPPPYVNPTPSQRDDNPPVAVERSDVAGG
ncbi:hypothetical protein BKA70DRAFT_1431205 [Coprinopsis sp. MPI-PUGE-AT-0042]|nr:hypothetical protein BKA70DRAFT_1431205 [Coprinopsis sp. MPI-PUGE-AT-0042]